jgi:hypothetical protein
MHLASSRLLFRVQQTIRHPTIVCYRFLAHFCDYESIAKGRIRHRGQKKHRLAYHAFVLTQEHRVPSPAGGTTPLDAKRKKGISFIFD